MEERTISMMVGKGSISHNNRNFSAKNVDRERSGANVVFVHDNLKNVYHELFDVALAAYNQKQKRADRKIDDYYEKIRQSKQEKLFHELIVQIGNKEDSSSLSSDSFQARLALQEYMSDFQKRNPNLRVFNAVLHMDEATPHLHIDFVPFSTGNKRGLETKVSLKGALKAQGFEGTGRHDTEWGKWVASEKACLAEIMEKYQLKWLQKGTHEKHLSVYDYEKKMRMQEVRELEWEMIGKEEQITAQEELISVNADLLDRQERKFMEQKRQSEQIREEAEQTKQEAERTKKEACETVQTAKKQKEAIQQEVQQWERYKTDARERYQSYLQLEEKASQRYRTLAKEKDRLAGEVSDLQEQLNMVTKEKKEAQEELETAEIERDVIKTELEQLVSRYEKIQNNLSKLEEQSQEIYQKYRQISANDRQYEMFEDMVQLKQENAQLKEENRTLREKLQQAYDFMKQFVLDGKNMLEQFLETVDERVQNFMEHMRR